MRATRKRYFGRVGETEEEDWEKLTVFPDAKLDDRTRDDNSYLATWRLRGEANILGIDRVTNLPRYSRIGANGSDDEVPIYKLDVADKAISRFTLLFRWIAKIKGQRGKKGNR